MLKTKQPTRHPVIRGLKYLEYASAVEQGDYWSRADFAAHFGVSPTCANYHADRAVEQGLLIRQPGFIGNQPGYVYSKPKGESNG